MAQRKGFARSESDGIEIDTANASVLYVIDRVRSISSRYFDDTQHDKEKQPVTKRGGDLCA